jgi:hypothetical protein
MSVDAVAKIFKHRFDDPIAKLIMIGIADRYNPELGYAYPAVKWLAECADCTDRTVRIKLKYLEEINYISRTHIRGENNTNMHNQYRINFDQIKSESGGGESPSVLNKLVQEGVKPSFSTPPEAKVHPKHSININNINNMFKIEFDQFWEKVIRKEGKAKSYSEFRKAMKKISAVELMPKLEKFNAFHKQQGTDKKFIPLPETWLRGERWNDEIVVENLQPQAMTKELFNRRFGSAILLDHCKRNKPMLYAEALQKGWITNDSETS